MKSGFSSFPQASFDEFVSKLEAEMGNLPKQEARLAQFIILNLNSLSLETGKSLSQKVGVSEVTVGRLLRRLGCDGMKGLRVLLREHHSVTTVSLDIDSEVAGPLEQTHEAEMRALNSVFRQAEGKNWETIIRQLTQSEKVDVTGFQSVRGIAEDFARRLALARKSVHFLAAHDGMLGEWLDVDEIEAGTQCLVLIDVVPYATESQKLAELARRQGRSIVVVSDEYCHWSRDIADGVIYAPSNTGLFLESTVGIVTALSLMIDAVAKANPIQASKRLSHWKMASKRIGLFH